MAATSDMRTILLEQIARTSLSSKLEIRQLIEDSASKAASIDREIAHLNAHRAKLEPTAFASELASRSKLRDRELATAAALHSIIAPVCALPVELLVEIFTLTIRMEAPHFADVFRVTHVCSEWREIAHGAPQLWTGPIELYVGRGWDDSRHVNGLRWWLARSAPLSLAVSMNPTEESLPALEKELVNISPRWRSLKLRKLPPSSFLSRLAERGLENLEELILPFARDPEEGRALSFGVTPRLRKLTAWFIPNSLNVPWAQLTDVCMVWQGASGFNPLDILVQCPKLVQLSLIVPSLSTLPPSGADIILLPHLCTLNFEFLGSGEYFTPFLERLSAPALESFRLDPGINAVWMEPTVTAFQLRSPNVTHLELFIDRLTSADLRTVLLHTPSLTHLEVHKRRTNDTAFPRVLQYHDGEEALVPRLHDLIINCSFFRAMDTEAEKALMETIASRWWTDSQPALRSVPSAVARWTRVVVTSRFAFGPNMQAMADTLADEGLDVKLMQSA
ncbi:hypothetical protein B0H16DRAFT_1894469 [Mycena metata]|uniref:F-box domain-containing protein n=1 Tax=Mycena metata TaxID=1033252 RepID=A0AAD7MPS8_9AGAR|nr:hypothetical protein B0H16DRAFT_1894469 [Mycena metata]